ncbi:MAG: hypothetical protein MI921_29380 [Cytophagales bacterium]|nr:hypothetical protein [Cytophagales bacterium]
MRQKHLKRKIVVMAFNTLLFHFTLVFSTYGQVGLFEQIELNRVSWPHIRFAEGGVDVARIQGVDGKFAVTSVNGVDQLFTVNTSGGNVGIGTNNPTAKLDVRAGYIRSLNNNRAGGAIVQSLYDPETSFARAVFSHNAYWDFTTNQWNIMGIGANDAHPNNTNSQSRRI